MYSNTKILIIATILLVCGAGFPFLMIIKVVPTTFWLSFLSYGSSVVGLVLGMYGVTTLVIRRRKADEYASKYEEWRDQ